MYRGFRGLTAALIAVAVVTAHAETPGARWVERFALQEPPVSAEGVCAGAIGALPDFTVTPVASGTRLVRVSLPFAPGALPAGFDVTASCEGRSVAADVRAVTMHPGAPVSARRALVTFPFDFDSARAHRFALSLALALPRSPVPASVDGDAWRLTWGEHRAVIAPDSVELSRGETVLWRATLLGPERTSAEPPHAEIVELGNHYLWVRLLAFDEEWPRIIELQLDSLGVGVVQAHLQRAVPEDGFAPDFGWRITGPDFEPVEHAFADGAPCVVAADAAGLVATFPVAPLTRRGTVSARPGDGLVYLRCGAEDRVPFQSMAWRRASFVIGDTGHTPRNALLEPDALVQVAPEHYDMLYRSCTPAALDAWPVLDEMRVYARDAIVRSMLVGDDYGNVTSFTHGVPHAAAYGMNRLNHAPAILEESYRSGDRRLRDTAVLWCGNMHDLSLWWGDTPDFGGTRYNNAFKDDPAFMWRGGESVHFCTKGFDTFFYAYEETGDPRMANALHWQVAYAREFVHAGEGGSRNIGDALDFMRLYRFTGVEMFREQALRLFGELRENLSDAHLFSESGQPIVDDVPFIDDDKAGYQNPFAKPYIIGYALQGLPELFQEMPDEPRLRETVRAVADFLAESQDAAGGWRYPHPKSTASLICQGVEHCAQLARAAGVLEATGVPIAPSLDAIECTLQMFLATFAKSGAFPSRLEGWERAAGVLENDKTVYDLYARPEDRDSARDFTEGAISVGYTVPDGLAYLGEVVDFYLKRRPAERLFHTSAEAAAVLARIPDRRIVMTPLERGSYVRLAHPENPEVAVTLWAPEWTTHPEIGYGEFDQMPVQWRRDETRGALWYRVERDDATLSVSLVAYPDRVECAYTVWPRPDAPKAGAWGVGPCLQMKGGVFDGEQDALQRRLWFLDGGRWTTVAEHAADNPRNVLYLKGRPSPDMIGAMAESGWRTLQTARPDNGLIACVSPDGAWLAATASESSDSLCNNAGASHRCIHSQGATPLRADIPTTLRTTIYLMNGSLDDLRLRYERDSQRWAAVPASPPFTETGTLAYGVRNRLPGFRDARAARLDYPLSWQNATIPFPQWRREAREAFLGCVSEAPPRADFAPRVIAVEDRGSHEARKLSLSINADARVKAYLLVPKGEGPFPGILALHDHGAHFSIGKEKVVRPFEEPESVLKDAQDWVEQCYGGRYIGDELASRGYVVFAVDLLYWGDRGRLGGVSYEDQQGLASNLLSLGQTWAGYNLWDDLRAAEFLQSRPEVIPDRVGCIGLSMGAYRTWNLAAATDIVQCGAAICWMCDNDSLTADGNNFTTGFSAFSMNHPGLRLFFDYPDVAAIACPKPMLFFNGLQDGLFPIPGVERCYARMREVWESQGAGERLVTRLWDVPHVFNPEMQEEAFRWLDRRLKPGAD